MTLFCSAYRKKCYFCVVNVKQTRTKIEKTNGNNNEKSKEMENKIEIKTDMTVEELTQIIFSNDASAVAKAVHTHIIKQVNNWYEQYDRANKAEKELAEIKAALVNYAIKQLNQ